MKRMLAAFALIFVLFGTLGCTLKWEHTKRHLIAFRQDVHEMHRFVDKHLFNYDDRDPGRF